MPILFRPVVACVEVKLKAHYKTFTDECVMTVHAKTPTSAPDAAVVEEIVSVVHTWADSNLSQDISDDWYIFSIYGESMAVNPPPFFAVSTAITGQLGASPGPIYAPEILLHGPVASRSELGRSYVFSPEVAMVGDQGYDGTHMTHLVTDFQLLGTQLADAGYNLAVPSKKLGQCVFVNSVTYSPRQTIQKRRRPGFGG